jgi:hypothetical protein
MGGPTPIYTPFKDLVQKNFHKSFHVCIDQKNLLKSFLINSELKVTKTSLRVNSELIEN